MSWRNRSRIWREYADKGFWTAFFDDWDVSRYGLRTRGRMNSLERVGSTENKAVYSIHHYINRVREGRESNAVMQFWGRGEWQGL